MNSCSVYLLFQALRISLNSNIIIDMGAKSGWDFRIFDLVKNLDGTDI